MSFLTEAIARRGDIGSIAIVGNAPKIVEANDGELIDSHGTIIRINDGRSIGFEKHCGSRTDIRFVGVPLKKRYINYFTKLREESLLVTRGQNREMFETIRYPGKIEYFENHPRYYNSALKVLSKVVPISEIPERPPRTGILILSLLIDLLGKNKITLFGFEIDKRVEGLEHYYNDGRDFKRVLASWDSHCPMEFEFALLIEMRNRGLVDIR